MDSRAYETPLFELLERVPEDARAWYEHSPTHHSFIPYGLLCRRAAAEIRSLNDEAAELIEELRRAYDTLQQHGIKVGE